MDKFVKWEQKSSAKKIAAAGDKSTKIAFFVWYAVVEIQYLVKQLDCPIYSAEKKKETTKNKKYKCWAENYRQKTSTHFVGFIFILTVRLTQENEKPKKYFE